MRATCPTLHSVNMWIGDMMEALFFFFLACCCYIHLCSDILLSALFPKAHNLCSSLNKIHKILHPHKTTDKINYISSSPKRSESFWGPPNSERIFTQKYSGREVKLTNDHHLASKFTFLPGLCIDNFTVRVKNRRTTHSEQDGQHSRNMSYPCMSWCGHGLEVVSSTSAVSVVQEVDLSTNRWLVQQHSEMFRTCRWEWRQL